MEVNIKKERKMKHKKSFKDVGVITHEKFNAKVKEVINL
jgi:hypothetical protein